MGCHHSAWTLSALTTTPVVATRDHPLADVHTVVLADPNFAAQAYYALPHLFNVIMAHHMTGVNMSNIMDNLDGLVRVACTVPGLQQTGMLHQVLSLARGIPPFRAMLRIWTTAQCALALRLDHLVHVAVPPGQENAVNHRFRRGVAGLAIQSLRAYCLQRVYSSPREVHEAHGYDLALSDLCRAITLTEEGLVDEAQTLARLHDHCRNSWPRCHLPNAIVVASVVALGRDGDLDVAWISFLHIYDTVTSLMLTHLTDLARAFDVDFAVNTEWGGCWDISIHLGLPGTPDTQQEPDDPMDVRHFLVREASEQSAVSDDSPRSRPSGTVVSDDTPRSRPSRTTEYEFESVPDSG